MLLFLTTNYADYANEVMACGHHAHRWQHLDQAENLRGIVYNGLLPHSKIPPIVRDIFHHFMLLFLTTNYADYANEVMACGHHAHRWQHLDQVENLRGIVYNGLLSTIKDYYLQSPRYQPQSFFFTS